MEAPNKHFVILSKLFRCCFDLPPDSPRVSWLSVGVQEKRDSESTRSVVVATPKQAGSTFILYLAAIVFFGLAFAAHANELTAGPNDQIPIAPGAQTEKKPEPFAFADFTWLTGNSRQHTPVFDTKAFTGELRVDTNFVYSNNNPKDHTIGGSTEVGRTNEVQLQQFGIGGDFHWENVRGRSMTPRNDPTPGRGQWNLDNAYRYLSEAYGGYHFDRMNGINVDAGIFMSYIGLFSYYNYDNWAYQPSYVSSNTPWFFNGVRIQIFPNDHFKEEIWLTNGWQSYGAYNSAPGIGSQTLWRPNGSVSILSNNYFWGKDTLGNAHRKRAHSDTSIEVKYLDRPVNPISKAAFSVTLDLGCEYGGGVKCGGGDAANPSQYFLGFMLYNRVWFHHDKYAVTLGGGAINNPGRYLVLLPPINGATAFSGTPYFTQNPGDKYRAWDATITFDQMPNDYITFREEIGRRVANVPYFSGHGGITPAGGNQGPAGSFVNGFAPDLRKAENRAILALLVKF
jgi:hypothetical protein